VTGRPPRAAGHQGPPRSGPGRGPGRADRPWAGNSRPGHGRPGAQGDLPAAVHLRAHGAAPRVRRAVQDRCLVPRRRRPRGHQDRPRLL